jgi:hypothetical protein
MSAASGWFVSVVALLGLVLALHQLGIDVTSDLGTILHGVVHVMGQPLLAL